MYWSAAKTPLFDVQFGATSLSGSADLSVQRADVVRILVHPLFNTPKIRACDLALVELDHDLVMSDEVYPLCMPTYLAIPGSICVIAGWGRLKEDGIPRNERLRDATVPIVPPWVCADRDHYLFLIDHFSMMCAGNETGGADACQGDSGSPLVCMDPLKRRWQLHGVVSWGVGCGRPQKPGVYTKILPMIGWIRAQILMYDFRRLRGMIS